jgi:hypothetical protein
MKKTSTQSSTFQLHNQTLLSGEEFVPSERTIQNIMSFAAAYTTEKTTDDHYVSFMLN